MFMRNQIVSEFAPKFGVEQKHLYREVDFVDDALAGTVSVGEQFKVLDSVVLPIAVDVVDGFFWVESSANFLLHYVTVFKNVFACRFSVLRRDSQPDVPPAANGSSGLVSAFLAVKLADPFVFALFRTHLLGEVNATRSISVARAFFAAVHAGEFVARFGVFALACKRAFHRAVQRIAIKFFPVRGQVRQPHDEWLPAFFAGEVDWGLVGGRFSVLAMISATCQAAVSTFYIARVAIKQLPASFTAFLDRHECFSLFGDKEQYVCAGRESQVNFV